MKPGSIVAIWLLIWFLTLFAVLPFGVRTSHEAGHELVPGQADSAPTEPMIWRKLVWTTAIATLLMAVFWANYINGWVVLDDIPGWGRRRPN